MHQRYQVVKVRRVISCKVPGAWSGHDGKEGERLQQRKKKRLRKEEAGIRKTICYFKKFFLGLPSSVILFLLVKALQ